MRLDQDCAAQLDGVHRWRIVYDFHAEHGQGLDRIETIAWFHVTAETAWADAAAFLPPAGYSKPAAVAVERGTFTTQPEGGYGWQYIGPTQTATVDHNGLRIHDEDHDAANPPATPAAHADAITGAGQQHLF